MPSPRTYVALITALSLTLSPAHVFAAFSITDNFDSYSDGDLTGQNGGSGWSAAWSGSTGYDVQGTTVYSGAKAITDTIGANQNHTIIRDLSSETSGDFYVAWRTSSVSAACGYFLLREGASGRGYIRLPCTAASTNLTIYNNTGGTYENIATGLSANTWYVLHVQFDATTDQYRARHYDGSWSAYTAYKDMVPGTGISRIEIQNEGESSTTGTMLFDEIQTTDPFPEVSSDVLIPTTSINNGAIKINNGALIIN